MDENFVSREQQWRQERLSSLTASDGWLTLTGLAWLEPGSNTIGSASDSMIAIPGLPERLGVVDLAADGTVTLRFATMSGVWVTDGQFGDVVLLDDSHPQPTVVRTADVSFFLVRRGGRAGLRIKDANAPTRTAFSGLDYFPPDPSWCIRADWEPAQGAGMLAMRTAIGTIEEHPIAGRVSFERDGNRFTLVPVIQSPDAPGVFVVFADVTGREGLSATTRFLHTDAPEGDTLVLNFNRAYNPPREFTAFATCMEAADVNKLDLRITAGEKKYRGPGNAT